MQLHMMSGCTVNLLNPDPDTISLLDIAHNLARINRFNGATKIPYSVADHSVWVSKAVPEEHALAGLLHDASEAYLGDIVAPLKPLLRDYCYLEERFDRTISDVFGVGVGRLTPHEVRKADKAAALLEMFAVGHPAYEEYQVEIQNLDGSLRHQPIVPRSPEQAAENFINRFDEITGGDLWLL